VGEMWVMGDGAAITHPITHHPPNRKLVGEQKTENNLQKCAQNLISKMRTSG
jgi:hypothetical protein